MANSEGIDAVLAVKHVSRETQERLAIYHRLLVQWQKQINLVAPSTLDEAWTRHFADSVQMVELAMDANHVIDLGSGAGFPGLILAICRADKNDFRLDMVESVGKKCAFLRAVVRETGVQNVHVHNGRIEAVLPTLPKPDVISARALASLDKLLDMGADQLTRGSAGLFPKGRDYQAEIDAALKRWDFDCAITPSRFDAGVILRIENLRGKA
ncbi:MAG: 16S rRNA (guanine(527)-N(7))-methyltransferase RsmG [Pseudomonadota bacterium]